MRKLLSAGMLRLRKNRLFYLGNAVLFCLGIFFAVGKYFDMQRFQIKQYLDDCLFLHVIFAGEKARRQAFFYIFPPYFGKEFYILSFGGLKRGQGL